MFTLLSLDAFLDFELFDIEVEISAVDAFINGSLSRRSKWLEIAISNVLKSWQLQSPAFKKAGQGHIAISSLLKGWKLQSPGCKRLDKAISSYFKGWTWPSPAFLKGWKWPFPAL